MGVTVALRKESVDRNIASIHIQSRYELSLSARRAWIEISLQFQIVCVYWRRSPQGERG